MARVPARGSKLYYDVEADSPRVWIQLASVFEMPTPTGEKPEIDATALEDDAAVFFLDIPDFGTVTMRLFMEPTVAAQYQALAGYRDTDTLLAWKVENPISVAGNATESTHIWNGRVQTLGSERAVRGMVTTTLGIRCTGTETFTPESA